MAIPSIALATIALRTSSEVGPLSLTKAATSHAESKIRVPSTVTVVMERPRTGGVAINCSQIFSSQFSKSDSETLGTRVRGFCAFANASFVLPDAFCSALRGAVAFCLASGTEGLVVVENGDGLLGFK